MATAEQKLAAALGEYVIGSIDIQMGESSRVHTTPIERLFMLALLGMVQCQVIPFELKLGLDPSRDHTALSFSPQHDIDGWLVDYLFEVVSNDGKRRMRLIVECDGHDYHERTKEQAKRDRARDRMLQEKGYTIYRFTGSELFNGAFECATQVVRWAENAVWIKGEGF